MQSHPIDDEFYEDLRPIMVTRGYGPSNSLSLNTQGSNELLIPSWVVYWTIIDDHIDTLRLNELIITINDYEVIINNTAISIPTNLTSKAIMVLLTKIQVALDKYYEDYNFEWTGGINKVIPIPMPNSLSFTENYVATLRYEDIGVRTEIDIVDSSDIEPNRMQEFKLTANLGPCLMAVIIHTTEVVLVFDGTVRLFNVDPSNNELVILAGCIAYPTKYFMKYIHPTLEHLQLIKDEVNIAITSSHSNLVQYLQLTGISSSDPSIKRVIKQLIDGSMDWELTSIISN